MLSNIILDIKYKIASFSSITWYKLYLYDEEFHRYARTTAAINEFIQLFTLVERLCDGTGYARVQTSIFGLIHSFNDEPAVVFDKGEKIWCYGGYIYRGDDKPAIIWCDGTRLWYNKYNINDRDNDKPSIVYSNGTKSWNKDGILHRDNDLSAHIRFDGTCSWYQNGLRHRDNDKPAVVLGDRRMWFKNGKRHRENNKPSLIWDDGHEEWYRDGIEYIPEH
jgi:hypothetical protein